MQNIFLLDNELIERLRKGDENALDLLFKKYWRSLFVSAFNLLDDRSICEDIVQDIFIQLWTKRTEIEITVSLKAYLFASMRYAVYRQIKLGKARGDIFEHTDLVANDLSPYEILVHKDFLTKVDAVIYSLPDKCREVYRLSREEQLSHKEISERLNISPKTVETHITKALKHLRVSLKETLVLSLIFNFLLK